MTPVFSNFFPVRDYSIAETLGSGQAFRWRPVEGGWEGVVGNQWVRLEQHPEGITTATTGPAWKWLEEYLQLRVDLATVLQTFPQDEHLARAAEACRGLRLLRQPPWECLASFILSSTKQIVQIQQIVEALCRRFGDSLAIPEGHAPAWGFPPPERIAAASEAELRECKMGFRAPYLKGTAEAVAERRINVEALARLSAAEAREALLELPGVGRKIADCVLLFAYGFQDAFPVDVWVLKALRQLYFPKRRPAPKKLLRFTETYFGPYSGYAQQYLFHYMRTRIGRGK